MIEYMIEKNKRGFTLIELLAVIVILAIIALVSTPIIIGLVENAKKSAFEDTAYGIINAAEYRLSQNIINGLEEEMIVYSYDNGVEQASTGDSLSYSGSKPVSGTVIINSEGQTSISIYDGEYCATKNFSSNDVEIIFSTEENCSFSELTEIEILVVAGGGSGGSHSASTSTAGSGGGAGGLIYNSAYSVIGGNNYNVTVGNGGLGTTSGGNKGENSVFDTLIAYGGGRGTGNGQITNASGGSGGGDSYYATQGGVNFGIGIVGQGNNGGNSETFPSPYPAAGGGGAGSVGGDATATVAGNGGSGLYYGNLFGDSFGASGYFAGGGGGGIGSGGLQVNAGIGTSGAGDGGYNSTSGTSALANTGSGGGGSSRLGASGGNGGSGIILIRYPGPQRAIGGIVSEYNGYTIHAFLSGNDEFEILNF